MKVYGILIVVVLCACQNVIRPEKPEQLIPKDKMVQILVSAYTGNAARSINNRTLRDSGVQLDSVIYNKFNIDSLSFAQSNTYYASQINEYMEILNEVEKELSEQKATLDSIIQEKAKLQKDSLDRAREVRREVKDSATPIQLIEPAKN